MKWKKFESYVLGDEYCASKKSCPLLYSDSPCNHSRIKLQMNTPFFSLLNLSLYFFLSLSLSVSLAISLSVCLCLCLSMVPK